MMSTFKMILTVTLPPASTLNRCKGTFFFYVLANGICFCVFFTERHIFLVTTLTTIYEPWALYLQHGPPFNVREKQSIFVRFQTFFSVLTEVFTSFRGTVLIKSGKLYPFGGVHGFSSKILFMWSSIHAYICLLYTSRCV